MGFRLLTCVCTATLCLPWAASQPLVPPPTDPVFRIPVRLVTFPTLVFSSDGRVLNGLDAPHFHVFDNGQEQHSTVDSLLNPFSVAIAIQINRNVRDYVSFIARTGSTFDALLLGETGEAAVVTYADEVKVLKPFRDPAPLKESLADLRPVDGHSRMVDAGLQAISLLRDRPVRRTRILVLIGQPLDNGSGHDLEILRQRAGASNITIYSLTLPERGKPFVPDSFMIETPHPAAAQNGLHATIDVGKLISVLTRRSEADSSDPFSILAAATGGTQVFAQQQREFENAIASIGFQLRSAYQVSFQAQPGDLGFHTLRVEVDVPGARVFTRSGYWHTAE